MKIRVHYRVGNAVWPCQAWAYSGFLHLDSMVGIGRTWPEAKQYLLMRLKEREAARFYRKQNKKSAPPAEVVDMKE